MFVGAVVVAGAMSGCARNRDRHLGGLEAQDGKDKVAGGGVEGRDMEGMVCALPSLVYRVYFDYNSAILKPESMAKLQYIAGEISGGELAIQIEGHCDERGTQEYNLALGEQRAIAVKNALVHFGVDPSHLSTISYGEERPIVPGASETAYMQNRRVELN